MCKKGTYLNKDYVCELINPPNCRPREFQFNFTYTFNQIQNGLYYSPDFTGCNRCEDGFVGVWIPSPRAVCVTSLYHINNTFVANTLYIKNCVEYSMEGRGALLCRKCLDGFVRSRDQKTCFPVNALTNCLEATADGFCNICQDGFVMVNRLCVAIAIDNCEVYAKDVPDCRFCSMYE